MDLSGANWFKSSRSNGGDANSCVEVAFLDTDWFKSSRSGGGDNDACVEVALLGTVTAVRDTKQLGAGPVLLFPAEDWRSFVSAHR